MARRKTGDKKGTDKNNRAASGEENIHHVQADDHSIAFDEIQVGGNVGDIRIGHTIGYTAEQVSILLKQITTTLQPKKFDGRCPYKGLEVFEEEDAELFFGRERLVNELVGRVKESRTVFITGPSGSGKSSLVRAGLIHALKKGAIKGSERWLYETMKPGREPIKDLALAFSRLKLPELEDYFLKHAGETDILNKCAESVLSGRKDQRFVLFVDQFEEVFTQINQEAERVAFINMLAHAGTIETGRVIVLFAMRSDFVSNCATYPALNELLSQEFRQIGAMQPEELVSAIALPARHVGLPIEDELIARIINDMKGEPGALPLMQFALKDLFDSQQEKGGVIALTLKDYLQHGGIHKSLERHADATFSKLNQHEQELTRSIFSGLIEIGRGTQDTKRTALFDELIPANTKAEDVLVIVQKLATARLIITDEQAGKDTVTISHEKLIEAWPWLKKLVDENRDVIALQNEIASDAREWENHKREKSYLYTGSRLATARKQLLVKNILLTGLAREFVQAGISRQLLSKLPLMIISIGFIAIILIFIYDITVGLRLDKYTADFYLPNSPARRLHNLAGIYRLKGFLSNTDSSFLATQLFYSLSPEDQLSMFRDYSINIDTSLQDDLISVVNHLYLTLADVDPQNDNTPLLMTMYDSLRQVSPNSTNFLIQEELAAWITGRLAARDGDYESSLASYSDAIILNSGNPSTLFERAKVYIMLEDYENALADLDASLSVAKLSAPDIPTTTPTVAAIPASKTPNGVETPQIELGSGPLPTNKITDNIITPPSMPIQSPTSTCSCQSNITPKTDRYKSNFTTLIDIVGAIRTLIQTTPQLQNAFQVSAANYPNLQSYGLLR